MTDWLRLNGRRIATIEVPIIQAMDAMFVNFFMETALMQWQAINDANAAKIAGD